MAVDTTKGHFHKEFSRLTADRNKRIIKRADYASCDLLAMAIVLDNSIITNSVLVWSTVELGGVNTRGQLVSDWSGVTGHHANVRIVKTVDIEKAKEMYMDMVK